MNNKLLVIMNSMARYFYQMKTKLIVTYYKQGLHVII